MPARPPTRRLGWGLGGGMALLAGGVAVWVAVSDNHAATEAGSRIESSKTSAEAPPPPASGGTSAGNSQTDPLRAKLDKARRDFEADDFERAKKRLTAIVDRVISDGIQVGSPRAKLGAEAQLMLADIERATLEWPEPLLDADGKPMHPMDDDTTRVFMVYNAVFRFQDLGALQCAEARRAALFLDYAKWLWRTQLPPSLPADKHDGANTRRLVLTHDAAMAARESLKTSLTRPVPEGEGCRREANITLAAVTAFSSALPPGRSTSP